MRARQTRNCIPADWTGRMPAWLRRFDQVMGDREQRKFKARGNAGFVEDVRQMTLDSLFAQGELLGDVAVAAPLNNAAPVSYTHLVVRN